MRARLPLRAQIQAQGFFQPLLGVAALPSACGHMGAARKKFIVFGRALGVRQIAADLPMRAGLDQHPQSAAAGRKAFFAFKKLPGCRRSAFEQLDAPALQPLPAKRFELFRWKSAKVNIDYHVEFDGHYYSVPHALVRTTVELRVTATMVECHSSNQRVACHAVSQQRGAHTTTSEHMPVSHRAHLE